MLFACAFISALTTLTLMWWPSGASGNWPVDAVAGLKYS
jgi:hypothetical protein